MANDATIPQDIALADSDRPGDGLPVGNIEIPHVRPLGMVAMALLCFMSVVPALNGGFLWLDSDHIPLAPAQQTWHALSRIWTAAGRPQSYAPLSQTLLWMQAGQWQTSVLGYHLVNLLLHIASALCLWRLLDRLGLRGAFLAAAIWSVHPLQVQSVAWIANQPMLLAGLFGLLSLLSATSGFSLNPHDIPTRQAAALGLFSYHVLFVAAALSHPNLAVIPLVVLALIVWRRGRFATADVPFLLPSMAIGSALLFYNHHLAAKDISLSASDFRFTIAQRLLIAGRAVWFYVGKFLAPWPLAFMYSRWAVDAHALWQYTFPVALLVALAILALLSKSLGRAPLVVAGIFIIGLLPTLGLFDTPRLRFAFVADDYAYLAIAPLAAAVAHLIFSRFRGPRVNAVVFALAFVAVLSLASLSCLGAIPYRTATDLWNQTLAREPDCWLAHAGLAADILRQADAPTDAARQELEKSLAIHPHQVEGHIDIGVLLLARGKYADAAAEFEAARAVADQPTDTRPGVKVAIDFLRQEMKPQAAAALESLVALDGDDVDLRLQYARVLSEIGQPAEAADQCRAAIARDNGDDRAWADLATCLEKLGKHSEAADAMAHAIDIGPPDAELNNTYGVILLGAGRTDEAIAQFNAALKLNPRLVVAHRNLAKAYAKQGNTEAARDELKKGQNLGVQ